MSVLEPLRQEGAVRLTEAVRKSRVSSRIRDMLAAEARVVRGGETRMIPADQFLRTEEAALTGESVPADKTANVVPANATVGDRENMAFSGTMVVSGRAAGVAIATGTETELGRINQLLASVSPLETQFLRQIKKFGYTITTVIGVISVLIFADGKWGAW